MTGSLLVSAVLAFAIVPDVRKAAMSGDMEGALRLVQEDQKSRGVLPENIAAYSWVARGALQAKQYDAAEQHAVAVRKQVEAELGRARLESSSHLQTALGASIEVQAQAAVARGERTLALEFLRGEMAKWGRTPIGYRIQKNINTLSLVGKAAPPIPGVQFKGAPTLVYAWAHWCPDCKAMAPVLAEVRKRHPNLRMVALTRLYGYGAAGRELDAAAERAYTLQSWRKDYNTDKTHPVIDDAAFLAYGASTTPTFIVVDAQGTVRLYQPDRMTADQLEPFLK